MAGVITPGSTERKEKNGAAVSILEHGCLCNITCPLSAFASVYTYIFICYTFNILFIYTNGSFKDHGYTSLKKAVVKSNRQKTHTRHALSYFLGLLENLIEVRL